MPVADRRDVRAQSARARTYSDTLCKRLTDAVLIKIVTSHFAMDRMAFTTASPIDIHLRGSTTPHDP